MKVALYARVSSEAQAARGTIGSQLEVLRSRTAEDEVVVTYADDGYSGARLDRPGLDALRDAAEAGAFEVVWCLSPDRLARSFPYQMILDELARLGVKVVFTDSPPIDSDPQARLLVQMQGVIAEYERAKITERHRRGKLFRVRAGEAIFWKVPYGYRRVPRTEAGPARLEVYEPEAVVVRRIFDDYTSGTSMRQIARRLYEDAVPTATGKAVWASSTLGGLLRNPTYLGKAAWYRHESIPGPRGRSRRTHRPREDWVEVAVPAIVAEEIFAAAQAVGRDNSMFSPRNAGPGLWPTSTPPWATRRSIPRRSSAATGPSSPGDAPCDPPRSTARRRTRSGRSSSGISNGARSPSATAAAPMRPPASMSTVACVARSFAPTPPNAPAWSTSVATWVSGSPKRNATAGSARSKG